jgi:hypothetical protein
MAIERETVESGEAAGLSRWEALTERAAPIALGFLLIYAFVRALVAATGKVFWYDELLTKLVVAQHTWAGMMSAIRAPVDTQPPLFYLVERLSSALIHNDYIAFRLPSAISMVATVWFVYLYVRRARGATVAFLCALFCLFTEQFTYYAQEARPYSMLVACIAFALVCYQRADRKFWVVLLGLTLVLAESLHYLAVLAMVPFGLAEAYRTYATRKIRWGVWAALGMGAAALLPAWNILLLSRAYYGSNFFAMHFSVFEIAHAYANFLGVTSSIGTAIAVTLVLALLEKAKRRTEDRSAVVNEISEIILIVTFIALPFVLFVFAKVTHGGLVARYALSAVLGLAIGLGTVLVATSKRVLFLAAVFMFAAIGLREIHFWRFAGVQRDYAATDVRKTGEFILAAGHQDLPVVVPYGDILRLVWEEFPVDHRRMFYLISGNHTMDKGMRYAQRYVPVQVRDREEFLANNPKFLFFSEGPDPHAAALPAVLLRQGWAVEQLALDDDLRELDLVYKRP